MDEKTYSHEDLAHMVNQLTGSFLAFEAILRGMVEANILNIDFIRSLQKSISAEKRRITSLIPNEEAKIEFEQTVLRIMQSTE